MALIATQPAESEDLETVGGLTLMALCALEDTLPNEDLWPAWKPILSFCHGSLRQRAEQFRARARELHTMPYDDYLKTEEWQMRRRWALVQASHRCVWCGCSNVLLHVHHLSYAHRGFERRNELQALCAACHDRHHAQDAKHPPKSSGEIMKAIIQQLEPVIDRARAMSSVLDWWDSDALDHDIREHAKPEGIRHGTLFVVVDSNVWLDEIVRYRRTEILNGLRKVAPAVHRISFRGP